jgi:hypothetical protein
MIFASEQDFINSIRQVIREELASIKEQEEFFTIKETCEKLKISEPTLHRWRKPDKDGNIILRGTRIGSSPRFSNKRLKEFY